MLRARLDVGALARFLGHPDVHPKGPEPLLDQIVPILDVAPFLTGAGNVGGGFPYSPAGRIKVVYMTQPAAGADLSAFVPANAAWEVVSLFARFVASAAVANRLPRLVLDDELNNSVALIPHGHTFIAGSDQVLYWARGVNTQVGTINEHGRDLPNLFIAGPAWEVRTVTGNIQGADQWSNARLIVREWAV